MSTNIFDGVTGQYIDNHGKCRMLVYDVGVSLMTSPLPPLDVPAVKEYTLSPIRNVQRFIKSRHFSIIELDGDPTTKAIQGLWVRPDEMNSGIVYGYIPIEITTADESLLLYPFAPLTSNDPMRVNDTSELKEFIFYQKLGSYLTQYLFLEYSLNPSIFNNSENNIDSLKNKIFYIDENHNYNSDQSDENFPRLLVHGNSSFYRGDRIIVPSEEIADRLLFQLKMALLNDPIPIINYAKDLRVRNKYQNIFDFKKTPNRLTFISRKSLMNWKRYNVQDHNTITTFLKAPEIRYPYFYRNGLINNNRPVIVQNNEGGLLESAIIISKKWMKDKVNIAGDLSGTSETADDHKYIVLYQNGSIDRSQGDTDGIIIKYDDGRYGTILPL